MLIFIAWAVMGYIFPPFMWRQLSSKFKIPFSNNDRVVGFGGTWDPFFPQILFWGHFKSEYKRNRPPEFQGGGAFLPIKFCIKSEDKRSRPPEFCGLSLSFFFSFLIS